jgi:GT2 family glycosyltransferase
LPDEAMSFTREPDAAWGLVRAPCTALIVTYQSAAHIAGLLESLETERIAGLDLDVLVVDNASTDSTLAVIAEFDWVTCVESGGNFGYAGAVNLGNKLVPKERALLVLNPDLVLMPGTLARLLAGLERPGVGVVVPRLETADGSLVPSLRNEPSIGRELVDALLGSHAARLPRGWSGMVWDARSYEREQFADWAVGAALLVSSACRVAVGDWDERYFLYSEETDFLRRVRAAGLRVRYEPTAVVRHLIGGSGTSDGLYALCVVNSLRYYRRYHAPLPSAVFAVEVALCHLVRARRPAARLALRALLSRTVRSSLPRPTPAPEGPSRLNRDPDPQAAATSAGGDDCVRP